ncbi:hypothetical protein [Galbibacter sp. BG1]
MGLLSTVARQHFSFDDILPNCVVWLGKSPDERRIECDFDGQKADGSKGFLVINGAWRGRLYEGEEGCLYIIDNRGDRHEPIYIVDIEYREEKCTSPSEETPI